MKKIRARDLILALGILLLLGGLRLVREEGRPEALLPITVHGAEPGGPPGALANPSDEPLSIEGPRNHRTRVLDSPEATPAVGRVRVQARPGRPFESLPAGRVVLSRGGIERSVSVVRGSWILPVDLRAQADWMVTEVWSAGEELRVYPTALVPGENLPELHVYGYAGAFLITRDEAGRQLRDITVHDNLTGGGRIPRVHALHPGNVATLDPYPVQRAYPPFLEALPGKPWAYWVKAPGQQWGRVSSDQIVDGGLVDLDLEVGSDLSVQIDGFKRRSGLKLTVERHGRVLASFVGVRTSRLDLEGLPRGNVRVSLSFDEHLGMNPRTLVSSELTALSPGSRSEVRFPMPALPDGSSLGSIEGTLVLQEAALWSDTEAYARAEVLLQAVNPSPGFAAMRHQDRSRSLRGLEGMAGARVFRFDRVPAGEYTLHVLPLGLRFPVTVSPGQTAFAACFIPPVARTEVAAWCDAGALEHLAVYPAGEGSYVGGLHPLRSASRGEITRFTLISMPGELRVNGVADGEPILAQTFRVQAGRNERRMEILPARGPVLWEDAGTKSR